MTSEREEREHPAEFVDTSDRCVCGHARGEHAVYGTRWCRECTTCEDFTLDRGNVDILRGDTVVRDGGAS